MTGRSLTSTSYKKSGISVLISDVEMKYRTKVRNFIMIEESVPQEDWTVVDMHAAGATVVL